LVIIGLAALAIQYAISFGHHHDHADDTGHAAHAVPAFVSIGTFAADHEYQVGHIRDDDRRGEVSHVGEDVHEGHLPEPSRGANEACEICWSLSTLAGLVLPGFHGVPHCYFATQQQIPAPVTVGTLHRLSRANLPCGPPHTILV